MVSSGQDDRGSTHSFCQHSTNCSCHNSHDCAFHSTISIACQVLWDCAEKRQGGWSRWLRSPSKVHRLHLHLTLCVSGGSLGDELGARYGDFWRAKGPITAELSPPVTTALRKPQLRIHRVRFSDCGVRFTVCQSDYADLVPLLCRNKKFRSHF